MKNSPSYLQTQIQLDDEKDFISDFTLKAWLHVTLYCVCVRVCVCAL